MNPTQSAPVAENRTTLKLAALCTLQSVRDAGIEVRKFLAGQGLGEQVLDEWELVIMEAANNAVLYSSEAVRHLPITIDAAVGATSVEVRIGDHTAGFDFPEDATLPDPESEGGRGLYLIRALTTSVDYLRGKKGNVLVLTKNREQVVGRRRAATVEELECELNLLTEELAASYESLSAIFSFTSTFSNAEDPMALVDPWMKELARITSADWYAFFVASSDGRTLIRAASSGPEAPARINVPARGPTAPNACAVARAVWSRQDVWLDATAQLEDDDAMAPIARRSSGILHSVFIGATLVGFVGLGRHVDTDPFTAGQVNVIHTFSDFLGTQIRHAQVLRESLLNQVMRRDLEIAASIQQSLLPSALPNSRELRIFGSATSAREVGGDFFDVIGFGEGSVLVVIADVMGKGVPAALFAAILRTLVRSRRDIAKQPGVLLEWVAATLFSDFDRVEMFATMQLAYFDMPARRVHVAGAGHCPLIIASPTGKITELPSQGVPIGIESNSRCSEAVQAVEPGSRIILFTDGVTESRNIEGEEWGMERLRHWLAHTPEAPPAKLGEALLSEVTLFRGAAPVPDDITFVLLTTHS